MSNLIHKNTLTTLAITVIEPFAGKLVFQRLYGYLLKFTLYCMNIGVGTTPHDSGEVYVMRLIKSLFGSSTRMVIFDVGANVGEFSKLLLKFFNNSSSIYTFEPSKVAFESLTRNLKGAVNLENLGFSDEVGYVQLYTNELGSGLASIYKRKLEYLNIPMNTTEKIKLTTIDNYCMAHKIDRIHFLKLDIEGNEFKALLGAQHMLSQKNISAIQFEFGGCNIDSRVFFRDIYDLLAQDFKIYRIVKDGLYELSGYSELHELFITTNYLAVLKNLNIKKMV